MTSGIAPRLARNSLYSALKSGISLALLLVVMPYAIRVLGKEVYGIWALAALVTSYAQLSDFGIAECVVKYAAEYRVRQDSIAINRLVNTVVATYLVLTVVVGGLLWLVLPYIAREILLIPATLQGEAILIFRLAVGIFFVSMVTGVFASLIVATQQMGYAATVNIVSACLGALGAIVFLSQGFGLRGLIMTNAVVALVAAVLNVWFAYRLLPDLRLNPLRWADKQMLRHILGYSWKTQTSNLAQLLIFQLDRILLSRYLGLEAVTFYEVGCNIAMYARTFVMTLFSPMIPAASALHAEHDQGVLAGLYRRSFKFAALIAIPCCLLVVGLAHPFIHVWMGEGFALSAVTLQLLLPIYLLNILTSPGVFLLNGMNRPEIGMKAAVFAGVTNLFLCFFLIRSAGYFGLIAGIALSLSGAAIYFVLMLHHNLPGLEWKMYRPIFLGPLLVCVPAALLLHFSGPSLGLATLPMLGMTALLYLGGVALFLLKTGYLDAFERQILFGAFIPRDDKG